MGVTPPLHWTINNLPPLSSQKEVRVERCQQAHLGPFHTSLLTPCLRDENELVSDSTHLTQVEFPSQDFDGVLSKCFDMDGGHTDASLLLLGASVSMVHTS
jgi:hypothetical protein